MSQYQSCQIGFVIDSPILAAQAAPEAYPPMPPAEVIAQNLGNCLMEAVVYAAMLEKQVFELQAAASGQPFYLQ